MWRSLSARDDPDRALAADDLGGHREFEFDVGNTRLKRRGKMLRIDFGHIADAFNAGGKEDGIVDFVENGFARRRNVDFALEFHWPAHLTGRGAAQQSYTGSRADGCLLRRV